jgi:type IV pilus assembly protein PilC
MPTYQYEALNSAGKPQKGTIDAASSEEAIQRIKGQGFFPTSVREQKVKGAGAGEEGGKVKKAKKKGRIGTFAIGGVSTNRLTLFTRQMSTLQDAGLPLLRSIQILEQQQRPGLLKSILGQVSEDVEAGSTLSDAMAKHPKAFDRLFCKMINAGEIGGVLDVILQRLAQFLEKAQRLRRRIIGAMIYPVTVICIAIIIVTGIMYFVIPRFQEIFNDFEVELPRLTSLHGHRAHPHADHRRPDPQDRGRPVHAHARHADLGRRADPRGDHDHARHLGQLRVREGPDEGARLHPRGRDVRGAAARIEGLRRDRREHDRRR